MSMSDLFFASADYRLEVAQTGLVATLSKPDGTRRVSLSPLSALDTAYGPDETLGATARREGI